MEHYCADCLGGIETEGHFEGGETQPIEDPNIDYNSQDFFHNRSTDQSVALNAVGEDTEQPQRLDGEEEENNWFSEDTNKNSFGEGPAFILLLGEEDCLGEVDFVEVSKVLVVEVVAVSPHVEGEMDVDSDYMSGEFVHAKGCEIREVSHIVELDEEAYDVEGVDYPAQHAEVEVDKCHSYQLVAKADEDSNPGFGVVRFDEVVDIGVELWVILLSRLRHKQ